MGIEVSKSKRKKAQRLKAIRNAESECEGCIKEYHFRLFSFHNRYVDDMGMIKDSGAVHESQAYLEKCFVEVLEAHDKVREIKNGEV